MTNVRVLTAEEVEMLIGWAGDEGWNPGLGDAEAFRRADPDGLVGAFSGDELAAGISVVRYDESFGFLGLYISPPAYRGQGFGKAVWQAGMEYLAGRTIGLDGVPALQPYYRSVGFVKAHETLRLTGRLALGKDAAGIAMSVPLDAALALDRVCFPAPRLAFLENWLRPPRIVRAVFRDGDLEGYGVVRPCRVGNKIGPLFADTTRTALTLVAALADAVAGPVILDVPAPQQVFAATLVEAGLTPGFATARMYKGPPPRIDVARVFALTTLELG